MDSTRPAISRVALWTLLALFSMNLLNFIDRYILAAVLHKVQEGLNLGGDADALGGLLATIFFASYSIFSPVFAWLEKYVKRTYLLAAGVGIWSLATYGSGLATTFGQMVAARAVLGIGEAAYATLAPPLIADLFPREQRNRALAFFYIAIPVGSALGFVIGTVTMNALDWRWAFYVVGLPGLAVALASLFLPDPPRGATEVGDDGEVYCHTLPTSWKDYTGLLHNWSYVYNTLAMAMLAFVLGGLVFFATKYLITVRGMSEETTGIYLGLVVAVAGFLGTALGGWLGDRVAKRVRGGYFWLCGVSMIASSPFIALTLFDIHPLFIFGSMFVGLTLVFLNYGPSNAILVNVVPPNLRAAGCAANIFVMHLLGDIPSPYIMGLVSDWTGQLFWGLAITLPALLIGGVFFCLGAPHLEADQEAAQRSLRAEPAAV